MGLQEMPQYAHEPNDDALLEVLDRRWERYEASPTAFVLRMVTLPETWHAPRRATSARDMIPRTG
jgi:hypothetical protein